MNTDARDFQESCPGRFGVELAGASDGHSEFVLAQAGRNIRMRVGGHIWIYPKSHARDYTGLRGTFRQHPQFRFALDIEKQDSSFQRRHQFLAGFAHAGKNDFLGCSAIGYQHPFQFSTGHHIEATSLARQQSQNAQIGVRFHGIADGVRKTAESLLKRT